MNKAEALVEIKKLITEYQNSEDQCEAEAILEDVFSLRDEHNLDIGVMSIYAYHMMVIGSILPYFYSGSGFLNYTELKIPDGVRIDNLKVGDEVKVKFMQVPDEHEGLERYCPNDKYTTLVNSLKMDNLFKLRYYIYSSEFKNSENVISINIPELELFIKRLNQDLSSYSSGLL